MPIPDVRYERVVVETDRYRVEGDVALPKGSYRNALSDYINRKDLEFLLLSNVEMMELDGLGQARNYHVLNLAIQSIRLIVSISSTEIQK